MYKTGEKCGKNLLFLNRKRNAIYEEERPNVHITTVSLYHIRSASIRVSNNLFKLPSSSFQAVLFSDWLPLSTIKFDQQVGGASALTIRTACLR